MRRIDPKAVIGKCFLLQMIIIMMFGIKGRIIFVWGEFEDFR